MKRVNSTNLGRYGGRTCFPERALGTSDLQSMEPSRMKRRLRCLCSVSQSPFLWPTGAELPAKPLTNDRCVCLTWLGPSSLNNLEEKSKLSRYEDTLQYLPNVLLQSKSLAHTRTTTISLADKSTCMWLVTFVLLRRCPA